MGSNEYKNTYIKNKSFHFGIMFGLMLIGVISDTHNYLTGILDALDFFLDKGITTIFHCGDWTKPNTLKLVAVEAHKRGQKVYGVLGNNDQKYKEEILQLNSSLYNPVEFPKKEEFLIFKYKKVKLAIYHGDNKKIMDEVLSQDLEAVFVGHTHIPKKEFYKETQVMNPGSIAFSIPFRKKDDEIRTVGVYDTARRKFVIYEI